MKRLANGLAATAKAIRTTIGPREAGLLIGLGFVGYGAGLVYLPAGFVLPGAVLIYAAIAGLD